MQKKFTPPTVGDLNHRKTDQELLDSYPKPSTKSDEQTPEQKQIYIDFAKAREEAKSVNDLADQLEKMINNEYGPAMSQLKTGWTGDAANQFLGKGAVMENNLRDSVKELRMIASDILSTVEIMEKAQIEAQNVVQQKNY